MNRNSMFEYATRNKLRFPSTKGELTLEQLWDAPLRSRNDDFNLDNIFKAANKAVKVVSEESYVEAAVKSTTQVRCEAALEVIKYVIDTKLADEETAKKRAENKKEEELLLRVLAEKQEGKISDLSEKEIKARIKVLKEAQAQ